MIYCKNRITITDISMRASREAAASGIPVEYKAEDGRVSIELSH
jgi:hypothetical protein